MKPSNFEDLIAMVALYRPGPMELIPDYINRKHGLSAVDYIHPKLKLSLDKTFGIAIYQEQLMQMARDLAGFTLGEADVLRKAIGKKKIDLLKEQKDKFIMGCVKNSIEKETAEQIFAFIEPFAGYGFNRSHAACYALIAYQTAFLKANYPTEFMAALLTCDQDNIERVAIEVEECRQIGITVLPPDINASYSTFTALADELKQGKKTIRFGLNAIRNVGENIVKAIVHERKNNGRYSCLSDFLSRLSSQDLNKKSLEGLIKGGALDCFGKRTMLFFNIEKMLGFIKFVEQEKNSKQANLFGSSSSDNKQSFQLSLEEVADSPALEVLGCEREFLGLYVSSHPYRDFEEPFKAFVTPLKNINEKMEDGALVRVACVVVLNHKILTKKGDPMLFVTITDTSDSLEILVFQKTYKDTVDLWSEGKVLIVQGAVSEKDDDKKILVDKVWEVTKDAIEQMQNTLRETALTPNNNSRFAKDGVNVSEKSLRKAVIDYPANADRDFALKVKILFMSMPGRFQVYLRIGDKLVKTNFQINSSSEAVEQLDKIFGKGKVKLI